MTISLIRDTVYGLGKEAITWAPIAIGMATDNPTLLTIGEVSYAAFSLYTAYKSTSKLGRIAAFTNAALALAAPCTYHPFLNRQISATAKSCLSLGIGANNMARGGAEIASVAQKAAVSALSRYRNDGERDITKSSCGSMIGSTLRLGLGIYRVYTGSNIFQEGLYGLSAPLAQETENPLNWEPDTQNTLRMDPKYAKEEIAPRLKKAPKQPKFNPTHAKEALHGRAKATLKQNRAVCPPKSGQHHPNDVAFYKKIALHTSVTSVLPLNKFKEDRCAGTLYLRSEDTNYMHAKDNYVRAEDTGAIGELPPTVAEKLINEGRVWYRHIEKVKDICKHIDEVRQSGGTIKRLIIVGHGNPREMLLSQKADSADNIFKRFFSSNNVFQTDTQDNFPFTQDRSRSKMDGMFGFKSNNGERGMDEYTLDTSTKFPQQGCLRNLDKSADIIMISCSTGKQGSRNLADTLAAQVPGHSVISPSSLLTMAEVRQKTLKGKLHLYFVNSKGEDATYVATAK